MTEGPAKRSGIDPSRNYEAYSLWRFVRTASALQHHWRTSAENIRRPRAAKQSVWQQRPTSRNSFPLNRIQQSLTVDIKWGCVIGLVLIRQGSPQKTLHNFTFTITLLNDSAGRTPKPGFPFRITVVILTATAKTILFHGWAYTPLSEGLIRHQAASAPSI